MFASCVLALMSAFLLAPLQETDEDLWADLLSDYTESTPSFDMSDPLELSLVDAIRLSFGNNLTVRAANLDSQASVEGFGSAWGRFDSVLFTDVTGSRSVTAPTPTNIVGGVNVGGSGATTQTFFNLQSGVRGLFLSGTSWEFSVGPQRVKTQSGGTSDIYTASSNLTITHPLLRNGGDFERQGLEIAAHDVRIAAAGRDQTAMNTVELVVISYWNLVFSLQNLRTKRASVALAEELVDITRRTFDQGLRNRIEVVEVEAELAQRQEELIQAENTASQAMDELRRLVFAPGDMEQFRRPLSPTTRALGDEAPVEDPAKLEDMILTALARRPDILQRRWELGRADLEVERAENQTLSRFDMTAAYGTNSNEGSVSDSLQTLNDNQFDSARLTLSWEMPFGNRTAGYDLRRARVTRQRAGVLLREVELLAVTDVRIEERNVRLQAQRVRTTAESSRLNREVYEGEKRRLENDLSTPFQVRETLRNWLDAIDTELRARLDLEVSRVALSAAQGVLLESYGLATTQPEPSLEVAPPPPFR